MKNCSLIFILALLLVECRTNNAEPSWLPVKVGDLTRQYQQKQEPLYSAVNSKLEKIATTGEDYFYFAYYNLSFICECNNELIWIPKKGAFLRISAAQSCVERGDDRSGKNLINEKATQNVELWGLRLEQTQVAIAKEMFEQLPIEYKTQKNVVFGSPGATDGGAYWIKFREKGLEKSFYVAADLSNQSGNYSNIVAFNRIVIKQISALYDSEITRLP